MNFTSKKTGQDALELLVDLNREDLAGYISDTEAELGKDLEVSGFRKGKVPRDVIRKEIGEASIREAALQSAIQASVDKIVAEQKLDVLEASNLAIKENSAEKLVFSVALKLFPEVILPDLNTIKAERKPVAVDPKEVDDTLETIRSSRAILTDSADPAAKGDRVEVDFEITENGKPIEDGVSKNHPVTIGAGNFVPGFEDQLSGMKKGEHKQFSLTVPSDFANKTIAGKKLDFSVTMQDVKKVALPELTDEFARTLGKFENADQLILDVKDGLLEEKKQKENQRLRLAIINTILEKAKCAAPETMVAAQVESMIQNLDQDLHRHDMELNMYLVKLGKTQDDLRKDWRPEAERQVKMGLVLHAIAHENHIAADPKEVDEALNQLAQSVLAQNGADFRLDLGRLRARIQSELLNEKTLEFLGQRCAA